MSKDGLVFEQLEETVLEVRDTISNQQYRLESSEPIGVEPSEYEGFPAPTTDALIIDADELRLPVFYGATVRDTDGNATAHLGINGDCYTPCDERTILELHTPVKSYLRIDGHFKCTTSPDEVTFDFSGAKTVLLGARAWRRYPTVTITVSDSLTDLREAISYFGGEILTTSPERSFPTLRGHPPRIRHGESLDVPASLSKPESGLTVTVPRNRSALLTVAPLAYYLPAEVKFGEAFTIQTENRFTYRPPQETLTDAVKSVLSHCFFLDCIVRTEGLYPIDFQERREFESRSSSNLDFATLYEQSLPERTETYLQVDPKIVDAISADWPVTAVVEPGMDATEALPYLVYELTHIEPADPPRYTGDEARRHTLKAFTQNRSETRSTSLVFNNEKQFVDVPRTESRQTIWVGEGIPLHASKFVVEGYENNTVVAETAGSDSNEDSSSNLEITVVCNDETMAEESADVRNGWNPRNDFPMELKTYSQVSTDQLRQILESGTDYFHFVGHATPNGLECIDGSLDVATLEESNVETFFLNACQSYQQGKRLVERGSSGGIVTYSDVANTFALRIGSLISQLLNEGFPIGTCLSIVKETTPVGKSYTIVGTHGAKIIQPDGGPPYLRRISDQNSGFELEFDAYAAGLVQYAIGSNVGYTIDPTDQYYLVPSEVKFESNWNSLREELSMRETPVVYNEELMTKAEFYDKIEK